MAPSNAAPIVPEYRLFTEALSPWLMPLTTRSGLRPPHSSLSASFTQSIGVPLHDHTCKPSSSRTFLRNKGDVAENAHEYPLRAPSGAQTITLPKGRNISMRQLIPLALKPSSLEISINGLSFFIIFIVFGRKNTKKSLNITFSRIKCVSLQRKFIIKHQFAG